MQGFALQQIGTDVVHTAQVIALDKALEIVHGTACYTGAGMNEVQGQGGCRQAQAGMHREGPTPTAGATCAENKHGLCTPGNGQIGSVSRRNVSLQLMFEVCHN